MLNQHHDNQFAEDVPFMGGEGSDNTQDKGKQGASGTGLADPGNVHTQASSYVQHSLCSMCCQSDVALLCQGLHLDLCTALTAALLC